ncbi:MAG TPA: PTS sugar transporter subunit IIA [Candidatus Paceibacterota bacterium]|nr:PTS sugar transporter subunit IIA [Verrucomicrobiota bacterium]HRY48923.1 PTS sugar transporter subunit IIA [Candidatus Paceibacterota bacterium]HRZ99135.1 PTS sugar transporter subunit IIA [Candidatus Paceibacterota bacterium]
MDTRETPRFILSQWLTPQTIELSLRGSHRDAVLEELVSCIPELEKSPEQRETLLRALEEREQLCSTGIGDGIALPHARNAIVGLVRNPVLVFGRHQQGIPFGSIDNQPAKLFFLLVAPTVSQHLQVLARLSRLLREPRLRNQLMVTDRPEKVIQLIRDAEAGL